MAFDLQMFIDSPDAGNPDCLCSYCLTMIDKGETPLRFWTYRGKECWEGRLHWTCAKALKDAELISYGSTGLKFEFTLVMTIGRRKK